MSNCEDTPRSIVPVQLITTNILINSDTPLSIVSSVTIMILISLEITEELGFTNITRDMQGLFGASLS